MLHTMKSKDPCSSNSADAVITVKHKPRGLRLEFCLLWLIAAPRERKVKVRVCCWNNAPVFVSVLWCYLYRRGNQDFCAVTTASLRTMCTQMHTFAWPTCRHLRSLVSSQIRPHIASCRIPSRFFCRRSSFQFGFKVFVWFSTHTDISGQVFDTVCDQKMLFHIGVYNGTSPDNQSE